MQELSLTLGWYQYFRPQTISVSQLFLQVCCPIATLITRSHDLLVDYSLHPRQGYGSHHSGSKRNCAGKDEE